MAEIPARLVIQALRSPVLVIGPYQRVSLQNAAMTALLKLDFTGRSYVAALRQPAVLAAIDHARSDGTQKTARFTVRTGPTDRSFAAIVTSDGENVVVILEDQSAADETKTLRRDFVANVSHELRTPLTALLGFIETLQGPALHDPVAQKRFLGIMAGEADRLRRLVDDLLSLSRVEETERSRPTTLVDLGDILNQTVDLLAPIADKAGTALQINQPQTLPTIPGDRAQLQQVLTNLIQNALKYGATDAGITLTIHPPAYARNLQQEAIRLCVQDYGQGIPAIHLARLTERFYRVDDHRDRHAGGTGLGLAIVKHILNRHHGQLQFESVAGQGTNVTILLPTTIQTVS